MTSFPGKEPAPGDKPACEAIDQIIVPRSVDLGGFSVRRALPHTQRRMVGPFIFFDHFGPAVLRDGQGIENGPNVSFRWRSRSDPPAGVGEKMAAAR